MDLILPVIAIAALLFSGILGLVYVVFGGRQSVVKRLRRQTSEGKKPRFKWLDYLKRSEMVLKPLGEMIPRSHEEMSRQERRLVRAGIRRKDGPLLFYGAKLALAILLIVTFALTGHLRSNPLLFAVLPVFLGALLPDLWLARRNSNRRDRIQLGLPDALDLTVVCVEAGLGLDQSLMRIGQEIRSAHPDLSDELHLFGLEVNAGRKRADALRNLGNRTDTNDLKALVAVLIQTDRFGTSIAQSLRVFSDSMRTKRRQRAEERAAKMSIKMIPPLVFFVLPAMFVVILGPAVISMIRKLLPTLANR